MKLRYMLVFLVAGNAFAHIIPFRDLGDLEAGTAVPLRAYFSQLSSNGADKAKLPRAFAGVEHFPADGFPKIQAGLVYVREKLPEADKIIERIRDFYDIWQRALDDRSGINEVAFLESITENKDLFTKKTIDKIYDACSKSIAKESTVKINLMLINKDYSTESARAALCLSEPDMKACQTKHEAFLLLNQFFTEIIEQISDGIQYNKRSRNTLYYAVRSRRVTLRWHIYFAFMFKWPYGTNAKSLDL